MLKLSVVGALALTASATLGAASMQEQLALIDPGVTVGLDQGTFTGVANGSTVSFNSIPYAMPPIGDQRFRLPIPHPPYEGAHSAVDFRPGCWQQGFMSCSSLTNAVEKALCDLVDETMRDNSTRGIEDCLTINVVKPAHATPSSKLPVIVWIYGGGFQVGSTASFYDVSVKFVERSITLNQPVIFASMNFRNTALGFLASKEVRAQGVGNLGLQDQRLALRWVQKYISNFGGDPEKVTIWGQSSGAISVSLQMLANGGDHENLFRAAIMQSGGPIPVGDIEGGQKYYDDLVERLNCGASNDTLQCLRRANIDDLMDAVDASPNIMSYQGLALAWLPRVDGVFLTQPPQRQVLTGAIAKVPFINGVVDDEGSGFAIASRNLTTTDDAKVYLRQFMLPRVPDTEIDMLLSHYPDYPPSGSPFDTGFCNMLCSGQFKRMGAIQGDIVFHGPRRFLLEYMADEGVPAWSFLSKRFKFVPGLGASHGSDLERNAFSKELRDYFIRFINNLNPNGDWATKWPQYDTSKRDILVFDTIPWVSVGKDDFRREPLAFVANLSLAYPL